MASAAPSYLFEGSTMEGLHPTRPFLITAVLGLSPRQREYVVLQVRRNNYGICANTHARRRGQEEHTGRTPASDRERPRHSPKDGKNKLGTKLEEKKKKKRHMTISELFTTADLHNSDLLFSWIDS